MKILTALVVLALSFIPASAQAQILAPQPGHWSVDPGFAKDSDARRNISGAACATTEPPFASCFAVNDQKRYAQFFAIRNTQVVPGSVIRLLGDGAISDPDAEGAAYDDGYFYAAGSHGVGRMSAKDNASFVVFRFPVNAKSGKPGFHVSDKDVAPQIERSELLREAIRKAEFVGPYAEKPLDSNGVNIEGIAVNAGRLYLGFRGPSVDGRAFILDAAVKGVFTKQALDLKMHALALGENAGIRDLARVDDGILVLSGAVNEQDVAPAVYLWNPKSGVLKKIGDLGQIPPGAKAETILLLDQSPERYRVLVMYDGPANGQPMEYWLPRR